MPLMQPFRALENLYVIAYKLFLWCGVWAVEEVKPSPAGGAKTQYR